MRLDNVQDEPGAHRRVEGVATALERSHRRL
jgi:hypothetical protein